MTTFTKEQLISHARESVSYLEDLKGRASKEGEDCKVVLEMVERELELARIALASLEAEPVAWKVTFTQIDREYNTFTGMYSDKAEVERWVRLHEVGDFRADITPLYTAQPAPVIPDDWISCSERMPNEEDVLVYCSDTKEQMVGFHKGKGLFQFFYMNGVEGVCEPSHWMPLPEPPL